jgi:hypothetical protein
LLSIGRLQRLKHQASVLFVLATREKKCEFFSRIVAVPHGVKRLQEIMIFL